MSAYRTSSDGFFSGVGLGVVAVLLITCIVAIAWLVVATFSEVGRVYGTRAMEGGKVAERLWLAAGIFALACLVSLALLMSSSTTGAGLILFGWSFLAFVAFVELTEFNEHRFDQDPLTDIPELALNNVLTSWFEEEQDDNLIPFNSAAGVR
jgi:predicted lysophospholipase L1 biosynthesis ABC-type transport system permease subunit